MFYGQGLEDRLTGRHETCSVNEFKVGLGNRAASVRIPVPTVDKKCGYFEDRRPGANIDPYIVCSAFLDTIFLESKYLPELVKSY